MGILQPRPSRPSSPSRLARSTRPPATASSDARMPTPPDPTSHEPLFAYFRAERSGAGLLLAMGAAALLVAVAFRHDAGAHGAVAWPLALIGILEVGVGTLIVLRTDERVRRLRRTFASAPAAAHTEELRRMQRVRLSYRVLMIAEVALAAAGVLVLLAFPRHAAMRAIGAGCAVQGALLALFDVAAERRSRGYVSWLRGLAPAQARAAAIRSEGPPQE